MSEYGFQSYPAVSTLRRYAQEKDLYWTSRLLDHRQRGTNANDDLVRVVKMHFAVEREVEWAQGRKGGF